MAWVYRAGSRVLELGEGTDGPGLMEFPEVGVDASSEAIPSPRQDSRRFGKDLIEGQTVSMKLEVRSDERPLDDVWRDVVAAWRGDEVRGTAGALATLTADSGRSVFGRPRPVTSDSSHRLFGVIRAELVFECVDDLWYGAEEVTRIMFVPPVSGGLTFPAEAPFTFDSGPAVRNASVRVSGDVATWPVFEIQGPVSNPEVDVVGVGRLVFSVDLAYDQTLRVDTRPWARWVKRDGEAFPGALSPTGDRLSDVSLLPGTYQVLLRGYDPTGTAELRVITRPAFTSF